MLREIRVNWQFILTFLSSVEMTLTRTDLAIAGLLVNQPELSCTLGARDT